MTALAKIPVRMSVKEFLAWAPGDGRAWQLVDGVPRTMGPLNLGHGAHGLAFPIETETYMVRVDRPA